MQAQKPEQLANPESLKRRSPPWRLLIIAAIVIASAATFGTRLWLHASRFADTDNAVVSGHVQPVSTRIAGVVVEIAVQDNQPVKAGDVLLRLDPADAQVQIERLKAQLAQAEAAIAGSAAQIEQAKAVAAAASAQVAQAQARRQWRGGRGVRGHRRGLAVRHLLTSSRHLPGQPRSGRACGAFEGAAEGVLLLLPAKPDREK